jgi:long-chain fatty acid transport protein
VRAARVIASATAGLAGLGLASAPASAGGLARPNPISARGVGMGGAFTALADDVTALHFNPAALAFVESSISVGGEVVIAPRSYTPTLPDGTDGTAQKTTPVVPVPTIGAVGRFSNEGVSSSFTLGIGVWNSFGGKVDYEKMTDPGTGMPLEALDAVQDAVVEIVPGFAYRFDEHLAFGAALRVGIGLFSLDATQKPLDTTASAYGLGLSYTGGVLVSPTRSVRIGLTWRGPLTIRTNGTGTVVFPEPIGPDSVDVEHTQRWPQQLSLGLGLVPSPALRVAAQLDWAGWSRVDVIAVEFPDNPTLDQFYPVDWNDNYSVRLGGEYKVRPTVAVRAGAYFDSNAVPDRTIERQYLDDAKYGVAVGTSVGFGKWRGDLAFDFVLPGSRTVPDNRVEAGAWPERVNLYPGDHAGSVYSLAFAVARAL